MTHTRYRLADIVLLTALMVAGATLVALALGPVGAVGVSG